MSRARDVMTSNPSVCEDIDTLYEAVQVMRTEDCGVVPVVNDRDQLVGIVTDRDLCMQLVLNNLDPELTELRDVMSVNLVTCHPEDAMEDVLLAMKRAQVRRIPVVDDQQRCIGIISEGDIARSDYAAHVAELVHAVVTDRPVRI